MKISPNHFRSTNNVMAIINRDVVPIISGPNGIENKEKREPGERSRIMIDQTNYIGA